LPGAAANGVRGACPTPNTVFVRFLKFPSIASVIGVTELNGAALTVNAREFHPLEI
jgi:ABC-type amino acid transport system permease subunit